jgi:hypothetical protein
MTPLALVTSEPAAAPSAAPSAGYCRYCSKFLPPNAKTCPSCLHDVDGDKDVYELAPVPELGAGPLGGAIYALEQPAKCPQCRESINHLKVVGLTRKEVSFTSTLPRRGRVIVCPKCSQIISAELSGIV